jgi:hypothetical protein
MSNVMIGATKAPRESDINFRVGSMVYSSRNKQSGIVVTRDEYGRNKMINNAQTPVYFPKGKKVVAVYNRYLQSLDDKIGGIGAVKKQQPQWVFKIYEIGDVNEESGLAEYKYIKTMKVRRADARSAEDVVRKTYSWKATGKDYKVERQ